MGLILIPDEVNTLTKALENALTSINEGFKNVSSEVSCFADNDKLQGDSWKKLKEKASEYHGYIEKGMEAVRGCINDEISSLNQSVGSELLDEDMLCDVIERMQAEIVRVQNMIDMLEAQRTSSAFSPAWNARINQRIAVLEQQLEHAEYILKIYQEKLEFLYSVEDSTKGLFNTGIQLISAMAALISEVGVKIMTGNPDATLQGIAVEKWLELINNKYAEIEKLKEEELKNYLEKELNIPLDGFKCIYSEEIINQVKNCLIENREKQEINRLVLDLLCDCSSVSYDSGLYELRNEKNEIMYAFTENEIKDVVMNIAYANKTTKKAYIAKYLKENLNISDLYVAAIMGNMQIESGFSPLISQTDDMNLYNFKYMNTYVNGDIDDSSGWGLVQWSFPARKRGLLQYAIDEKGSATFFGDMDTQLEYLVFELKGDFSKEYEAFITKGSLEDATIYFCEEIEKAGISHMDWRKEAAKQIYDELIKQSENKGKQE